MSKTEETNNKIETKQTNNKIEIMNHEVFTRFNLSQLDLNEILIMAIEINASDVHVTSNQTLSFTFRKEILKTNIKMRSDIVQAFVQKLTDSNAGLMKLYKPEELDGSYRMRYQDQEYFFRYNISLSVSEPHLTIRKLINTIPSLSSLELDTKGKPFVDQVLKKINGIYLVVGETGSGKTTTLVSIINELLVKNSIKIITLESPIEFYYKPTNYQDSLILQKEIGQDTQSFLTGLRAAMRQAPDVILVGEIRDKETAIAALQASQSGHIVLATLHANGPTDAKDRLFNMLEGQNGFENSLRAAMFQHLYKNKTTGSVSVTRKWEIFVEDKEDEHAN